MSTPLLQPGQALGAYRIGERLGEGGMGAVFAALHLPTGSERALKVLPRAAGALLRERFLREGEALARVDAHPNVARIYELGEAGPWLFLALERVPGADLQTLIEREGPQPPERAVELLLPLCGAVAHLHRAGVLHRDLKPANVVLTPAGQPRLIDFGVARLEGASRMTATGEVLGSPAYMPPEQADGAAVSPSSDVYGLGVILYALLAGRPPFGQQASLFQVLQAVLSEPPPPLRGVPPGLADLVARTLAKDPAQRPQSADELAELLAGWRERPRRRRLAPLLALGAAALGLGLGGWALTRGGAQPSRGVGGAESPTPAASLAPLDPGLVPYLALCDDLCAPPAEVRERLGEALAELSPAQRAALAPLKRARLEAALAAQEGELARALRERGLPPALETLLALCEAAPALDLPPPGPALLDAALLARLEADPPESRPEQRVLRVLADFEDHHARLTGFAPPPARLQTWVQEVHQARGGGAYTIHLTRLALRADERGIGGNHGPLALGSSSGRRFAASPEFARLRRELPQSAALALVALNDALSDHRPLPGRGERERWRRLLELGALAARAPSELSSYWRTLALIRQVRLLLAHPDRSETAPALAQATDAALSTLLATARADLAAQRPTSVAPKLFDEACRNRIQVLGLAASDPRRLELWAPCLELLEQLRLAQPKGAAGILHTLAAGAQSLREAAPERSGEVARGVLRALRSSEELARFDRARAAACRALGVLLELAEGSTLVELERAWLPHEEALVRLLSRRGEAREDQELLQAALRSARRRGDREAFTARASLLQRLPAPPPWLAEELARPPR